MTIELPKPTKDDFHLQRSRLPDAFAALEEALLSPAHIDEVLAKEIKALRAIRNDLVHAQLKFVQLEGELQCIVVNSQNAATPARWARLVKIEDLKTVSGELCRIRRNLTVA